MEEQPSRIVARGAPVELSSDLIESLAKGEASALANRIIASAPLYAVVRSPDVKKGRFAPVGIDADELEVLRGRGTTPDSVLAKLEESAKQRGRFGDTDQRETEKQRPELQDPGK